ncbi:Lrp/AsnC family transcriptional regulator [Candidatus Woesearchaeota archaeon]|nr:Lrp/AsnC family transcriptional regulator [Candidatus Woesearchaeota archaeon]
MRLTENEKKTLKLMLNNPRIADSEIAAKLRISGQAVGKIRRKLEGSIIDSYSLNLNYPKLGVVAFAIVLAKMGWEGRDMGGEKVEKKLLEDPHIISVYRVTRGSSTHVILYGFRGMVELDYFFHSSLMKKESESIIEIQDIYPFSYNGMVKNSPIRLFHNVIDNLGTKVLRINFSEIGKGA